MLTAPAGVLARSWCMTEPTKPQRARRRWRATRKVHGADRSGLGDKGWAEVQPDRIGGRPVIEDTLHSAIDEAEDQQQKPGD